MVCGNSKIWTGSPVAGITVCGAPSSDDIKIIFVNALRRHSEIMRHRVMRHADITCIVVLYTWRFQRGPLWSSVPTYELQFL